MVRVYRRRSKRDLGKELEVLRRVADAHLRYYVEHLRQCPNAYTELERELKRAQQTIEGL